jgi:hypothetical protein
LHAQTHVQTNAEVKFIKDELDKARTYRTDEIEKKNETIRRLKGLLMIAQPCSPRLPDELREIKAAADDHNKRLEVRSKQKEDSDAYQFEQKETALRLETDNLRKQLAELRVKNREEEMAMRKRKAKIENESEAWISKVDQDMGEKQGEIDEISVCSEQRRGTD